MIVKPHTATDRHGILMCRCGFIPGSSDPLSANSHIGWRILQDHIRDNDDHLCHFRRYMMECLLPEGHMGIHREER